MSRKTDYYDMMRDPTDKWIWDRMKETTGKVERHSEFKKPYLDEDYPEMEHYHEMPSGSQFEFPRYPDDETFPDAFPDSDCICSINCLEPMNVECADADDKVIKCWMLQGCFDWEGESWPQASWSVSGGPYTKIVYFKDASGHHEAAESDHDGGSGKRIEIYPDWDNLPNVEGGKRAKYIVQFIDGKGNVCVKTPSARCREICCPAETTFEYDTGNPATVAREADATITVLGGCGDFTWSVAGTGFSFNSATTTDRTNTLSADATACGTATITVTDACGTEITGYVRCTTGTWVQKSSTCGLTGTGTVYTSGCTDDLCYELISGYQKQEHGLDKTESWAPGKTCENAARGPGEWITNCEAGVGGSCDECISVVAVCTCIDLGEGLLRCWTTQTLTYYEWECA